jgi:hypothetical protein
MSDLDRLLTQYEDGHLSRRDLLGMLALLVAAPSAASATQAHSCAVTGGQIQGRNRAVGGPVGRRV